MGLGAGAGAIVVVALIFVGPYVGPCSSSPDGLLSCITGKLSDRGEERKAEPQEETAQQPAPEQAAAPAGEAAAPAAQQAAPAEQAAAPAQESVPADQAAAAPQKAGETPDASAGKLELGLVRAQPDGSVIVAGSAAPGAEVAIYGNGKELGTTTAESSGDWVFIPDSPLPAGGVEITVGTPGGDQQAAKSVVVVIDPDHKSEPTVVAGVPGQLDKVLAGLKGATAPAETAQAAPAAPAAEQPATEVATAQPQTETPTPATEQPAAPAATATEQAAPAAETAAPSQAATSGEASPAESAPTTVPFVAEPDLAAPPPVPAPATASEQPAAPAEQPAPQQETKVAVAQPPAETPAPAASTPETLPSIQPSIDGIEIDGNKDYFAGAAPDGTVVRLYVDNQHIADSTVQGGRWYVEAEGVLTKPTQLVRIDVIKPDNAEVVSRAEVNFVVDLPKQTTAPQTEIAAAEPNAPAAEAVPATPTATEPAANTAQAVPFTPAQDLATPPPVGAAEPAVTPEAAPAASAQAQPEASAPANAAAATPAAEPAPATDVETAQAVPFNAPDALAAPPAIAVVPPPAEAAPEPAKAASAPAPAATAEAKPAEAPAPQPAETVAAPAETAATPTDVETAQAVPFAADQDLAAPPAIAVGAAEPAPEPAGKPEAAPATVPAEQANTDVQTAQAVPFAQDTELNAPPPVAGQAAQADRPMSAAGVPTLYAIPVGDPEAMRFISGKAIIRRGDNLWTIARRVYGHGIQYHAIYEANSDQIRDPHWIYPGQVFDLPTMPKAETGKQ
ncbi:MAG TPA: LysM peptidoglycan-binding domain-containing protein [Devosiaceae bacterium]